MDVFLPGFLISFSFAHLQFANKPKQKRENLEAESLQVRDNKGHLSFHYRNEKKGGEACEKYLGARNSNIDVKFGKWKPLHPIFSTYLKNFPATEWNSSLDKRKLTKHCHD